MPDINHAKPFQRIGSLSNPQVGKEFELIAKTLFAKNNLILESNHKVEVGIVNKKKLNVGVQLAFASFTANLQ